MYTSFVVFLLVSAWMVAAKDIIITVGGNSSGDGTTTFQPQRVVAELGDNVIFNFTQGNHSAVESTFAQPCVPAHVANISLNGFDSGFHDITNGTPPAIQPVPILVQNVNQTMWFFDYNTCGEGGVGVINDNESSTETLAGFIRNAVKLNGTNTTDSSSSSASSASHSATTSAPAPTSSSNAADRALRVGVVGALPLFIASLFL
ncbi:Le.flp1-like protein [Artomyces pyxidatus]|uniref:Le.flp1-like protein n=1 Tax=Artomyces pyxidatus TaxID=48021 RepID=A0ACB8T2U4_9AGAM|nr:Le.flp1-like protein [Artomyces pyxidatus]